MNDGHAFPFTNGRGATANLVPAFLKPSTSHGPLIYNPILPFESLP